MPTRAEVAAVAKVSPALVSYVLNGGPRPVSKAARERILAAVEELDYRPNPAASVLSGGSSRTVGILVPGMANPFDAELTHEIESQLFDAGYAALIGITGEDEGRAASYLRSFSERRADAVILLSSDPGRLLIRRSTSAMPVSMLGEEVPHLKITYRADARRAVEHLQTWGHVNIACVTGPRQDPVAMARLAGWRDQQTAIDAPTSDNLVAHTDISAAGGAKAARTLLSSSGLRASKLAPTAIFATSDAQALGALFACAEMQLAVPGKVSVVGCDGTLSARYSVPALTTMRLPLREVAAALIGYALYEDRTRKSFSGNLVIGDSCGAPPSEA